jgi:cell division protein FtsW
MAEELGFIRTSLVLVLFAFLTIRGIYTSLNANDLFGKILGVGIATWIGLQVCINVSSILGLLPLTGITLPLFSHGSSSLIVILAGTGILLNISKKTHTPKVYDRRVHA